MEYKMKGQPRLKLYSIYLFSCLDKVQNSDLLVKQLGLIGIKVI